ncbi:serine hydrolase [Qipengyuania sp. CAU 1752]
MAATLALAACSDGAEDGSAYQKRIEKAVEKAQQSVQSDQERRLDNALYEIGSVFDGYLGVAIVDVERGRTVHFGGNQLFPQQSVSKLWVTLAALEQVDSGKLSLDEPVQIGYSDLTVFHQPIRNIVLAQGVYTGDFGDLMRRAITASDNTANDRLLRRIGGPEAVRKSIVRNRLGAIRFGPGERAMQSAIAGLDWRQDYALERRFYEVRDKVPDETRAAAFNSYVAKPVDGATPIAIASALARLARGELLEPETTRIFLDLLDDVRSGPNRLKGGVPTGWTIGHKTGTGQVYASPSRAGAAEQAGFNDVGILTAPDGARYAVAVMIGRTAVPVPERMDMMHRVVDAVVRYHADVRGEQMSDIALHASGGIDAR